MRARAPTRKARPHLLPATDGLPLEVREVVEALVASLGDDLSAIYWQGSEAHAEAKPDSDHDLIIVMKRLDEDLLLRIQGVFLGRDNWSSFVQTEEELRQYPSTGRLQFHFGLVPLFGQVDPPPFSRENVIDDLLQLALDIRFECRYRLFHRELDYTEMEAHYRKFLRTRNARMLRYAAKLAVLALKTRAHWEVGKLHLHYKQGMNWGRDILTVSGPTLTLVRDLESGGASTTRTLTYIKS